MKKLKKLTFSEKALLEKGGAFIYSFSADSLQGIRVWYIVAVPPANDEKFFNDLNDEEKEVNLNDYGKILASGKGEEIPENIKQDLKEKYAFEV